MIICTSSANARIAPHFLQGGGDWDFNGKLKVVGVIFFAELCKLAGLTFPNSEDCSLAILCGQIFKSPHTFACAFPLVQTRL